MMRVILINKHLFPITNASTNQTVCAILSLLPKWVWPMPLSRRAMRVDGYDCWEKLLLCGEIKGFNKKNVDKN